jgi:hypothetical protein
MGGKKMKDGETDFHETDLFLSLSSPDLSALHFSASFFIIY